jgi:hypothetical protein
MGWLLLASRQPRDWDDSLSLLAQTMNIKRETPKLKVKDSSHNPNKIEAIPPPFEQSDRTTGEAAANVTILTGREFAELERGKKGVWVLPGNRTLTLLMEVCQKMFLSKASGSYWKRLTDPEGPFRIKPDSPSFHAYLRTLRQTKASSEAVRFVRDEMSQEPGAGKTFRIAMSTCVRNQSSPNVMREATELMDIMLERLRGLDARVGAMYMKLALLSRHTQDTLTALNYFTPQTFGKHGNLHSSPRWDRDAYLDLAKTVVGGFDRVISTQAIERPRDLAALQNRKAWWTTTVQQMMDTREQFGRSDEELELMDKRKTLERVARNRRKTVSKARSKRRKWAEGQESEFPVLESEAMM